jgi:hypothetical protein
MEWKIKYTGKFLFLLFFTLFCAGIVLLYAIQMSLRNGTSIIENLVGMSFIGFLFIMAWLFTFPALILRKKIPKKITLDKENKTLTIHFNKKPSVIPFENLAFNAHHHKYYSTLNLYYVYKSKRGHVIKKRVLSLIGLGKQIGWHKELINDMIQSFDESKIEIYSEHDRSIFAHILGN